MRTEHDTNAPLTENDLRWMESSNGTPMALPTDVPRLVAEVRRQWAEIAELLDLMDLGGVAWPKWASERNAKR